MSVIGSFEEAELPVTLETFTGNIQSLIKKFDSDRDYYLSKAYSEAEARVDFITPFFRGLGWDVENEAGLPHHAREVLVEKTEQEIQGKPDYSFRIAGQTKFFVEAKAPHESLGDPKHILQAKGYAWNTKQVFFVVLTDFEEFRFYDASIKPDERKPEEGLLFPPLKYADYLKNAEKLWEFSRERVTAGSLDAMLPRDRRTERLRIPVDEAFLDEMTGWREELARDIYRNNHGMTARQLNEVVQRLLDRIVFIRIAEDRRIIERFQLRDAAEQWRARGGKFDIFDWLRPLFEKINDDFNGEIFKPSELLEKTRVDSEVLAKIIERLYPPKSPYRFDVIGVELLGSIYERYLGKTIRPTAKTVRVKEKPEVRKAGGVYYTPKYIVDYIVKNTVGRIIEGKPPKQIEKIRILDPACGSGSFLIGAFQCLIDYHVQWYLAHPEQEVRHAHPSLDFMREVHEDADGNTRLSVYRKAKILRNNIFGVDIDPQAVEITMMSLYLKALEGEKSQLPPKQHLLPELKYNIMCGNSLIGPDIYQQGTLFGDADRDRINAFDWNSETTGFGRIISEGGFDSVIGNPPWGYDFTEEELDYLRSAYRPIIVRMIDSFMFFVAKASSVLHQGGWFGMILPDVILYQVDNRRLRESLLAKNRITNCVNLGDRVFSHVTRPSCILVAQLEQPANNWMQVLNLAPVEASERERALASGSGSQPERIKQSDVATLPGKLIPLGDLGRYAIWFKISKSKACAALGELVDEDGIQRGVSPDLKDAFVVDAKLAARRRFEKPWLRKVLIGGDIKRYRVDYAGRLLFYLTNSDDPKQFPKIRDYISEFKKQITCTEVRDRKHSLYALHRARNERIFVKRPKLLGVITEDEPVIARDDDGLFATDGAYLFGLRHTSSTNYVLGVLNSRLFRFLYRSAATEENRVLAQVKPTVLGTLPIRAINFSDAADKSRHDKMVALVEGMLELNKDKHSGKLAPSELDRVEREIGAADAEIDKLVYELYGITDVERRIVEGA
jgi:type I restriction-modification system DNA methylase subunit